MNRTTTVLIVDDDAALLRLVSTVLRKAFGDEIQIEMLDNPREACDFLDRHSVDVLLTDLEMPEMSGVALQKFAKARNAFTQVLFLTGHSTQRTLLEALENGATDYLLKPVDRELLVELVRQAVQRVARWRQALGATWRQRRREAAARS